MDAGAHLHPLQSPHLTTSSSEVEEGGGGIKCFQDRRSVYWRVSAVSGRHCASRWTTRGPPRGPAQASPPPGGVALFGSAERLGSDLQREKARKVRSGRRAAPAAGSNSNGSISEAPSSPPTLNISILHRHNNPDTRERYKKKKVLLAESSCRTEEHSGSFAQTESHLWLRARALEWVLQRESFNYPSPRLRRSTNTFIKLRVWARLPPGGWGGFRDGQFPQSHETNIEDSSYFSFFRAPRSFPWSATAAPSPWKQMLWRCLNMYALLWAKVWGGGGWTCRVFTDFVQPEEVPDGVWSRAGLTGGRWRQEAPRRRWINGAAAILRPTTPVFNLNIFHTTVNLLIDWWLSEN